MKLFVHGFGYTAGVLADRLLALGWQVAGTSRRPEGRDRLAARGLLPVDPADPEGLEAGLAGSDALLLSAIGVADIGTDVLTENRQPLSDVVHLLVPTTDLTNQYNPALTCGLGALLPLANGPGTPMPGATLLQGFFLGRERYRYPGNLPRVAAKGGPQCTDLPNVGYEQRPPYVVTDIGANQAQYGNQGILLNSDALKQALFGPLDGPPRNAAQIGMPG